MTINKYTTLTHAELCQAQRMLVINIPAMTAQGRACGERDLKIIEKLLEAKENPSAK